MIWFGWVLWHINHCRLFYAKSSLYIYNKYNSIKHQSFVYTQLNDQTVLFLTIQFSISHLFAHSLNVKQFYLAHGTLSGTTSLGQSAPGSNGHEGVLYIP